MRFRVDHSGRGFATAAAPRRTIAGARADHPRNSAATGLEAVEQVDPGGELAPALDDRAARRIAQHVLPGARGLEPPVLAIFVDGGDAPSGAIEAAMRDEPVELRARGLRRAD